MALEVGARPGPIEILSASPAVRPFSQQRHPPTYAVRSNAVHSRLPGRFLIYRFVVPDALAGGAFPGPDAGATVVVAMNWVKGLRK